MNDFRKGMGRLAVHAFFILAGIPLSGGPSSAAGYGRALWVVRHTLNSPDGAVDMVDKAAEAGFNMLLVQVRGRGDAWYRYGTEPTAPAVQDADPLDTLIARAHDRGLQVHAWLNVLLVEGREGTTDDAAHVLNLHPGWVEYDRTGTPVTDYTRKKFDDHGMEGVFLSPGIPEARTYFAGIVDSLLTHYDLDGIHLDYLRYPGDGFGFNPRALERFRARAGFDPRDTAPADTRERDIWTSWRCAEIQAWLQDVREVIDRKRPSAALSVAVKGDYAAARERFGQDWAAWDREGLVDIIIPMMYDTGTERFRDRLADAGRLVTGCYLFAGIAGYNQPSFSTVHKVLEALLRDRIDGVALFSYSALARDERAFRLLAHGPFKKAVPVPVMGGKRTAAPADGDN